MLNFTLTTEHNHHPLRNVHRLKNTHAHTHIYATPKSNLDMSLKYISHTSKPTRNCRFLIMARYIVELYRISASLSMCLMFRKNSPAELLCFSIAERISRHCALVALGICFLSVSYRNQVAHIHKPKPHIYYKPPYMMHGGSHVN